MDIVDNKQKTKHYRSNLNDDKILYIYMYFFYKNH